MVRPDEDELAAPIILDLDGDGKTIVPLAESSTQFDMVGDGRLRKTAWADAGDAFLVRDRNSDGLINGISEISFVGDKAGAKTDLEAALRASTTTRTASSTGATPASSASAPGSTPTATGSPTRANC